MDGHYFIFASILHFQKNLKTQKRFISIVAIIILLYQAIAMGALLCYHKEEEAKSSPPKDNVKKGETTGKKDGGLVVDYI